MITVAEALQRIEEHVRPLPAQRVDLAHAAGLVLAKDVASDSNSPPYDKAMMDGFAIASSERQRQRRVIETVAAGDVPHHAVTPGTAIRIMTGAPMPDGADAVVPWEQVEMLGDDTLLLPETSIEPRANVMPLGASVRAGQIVVSSGRVLRPVEIAITAEAGHNFVKAIPRPKVAVLPTGNELVPVGQAAGPGRIRNSNGPLLCAAVTTAGAVPHDLGIGPDNLEQLKQLVSTGLKSDVLLLSGGVSAGDFDLVPHVLDVLGVRQVFHKVSLKPGKPVWFGIYESGPRNVLVFGLPGNPVSSYVCFELFVRPALAALAGRGFTSPPRRQARLATGYPAVGERESYLPAQVAPGANPQVELIPWRGSGDLAALAAANGLAIFPAGTGPRNAGDRVDVILF